MSNCKVPTCGRNLSAKGLCAMHYMRAKRLGLLERAGEPETLEAISGSGRASRAPSVRASSAASNAMLATLRDIIDRLPQGVSPEDAVRAALIFDAFHPR